MKLILLRTLILLLASSLTCLGQISVTFPADRAVFQRDNSNKATLTVAGHFSGCLDKIEVRFVPRTTGQGTQYPADGGWATLQNNPVGGNFYSQVPISGGWYKLEVRAILDNAVVASSTVERVGVGEVFIVAGQSNATGGDGNPNGPGATDDRVNSVNFQNLNANNYPGIAPYSAIQLPCPEFVHLDAETKTAPFGNYAWCWGAFGDNMVKKLQVPVMIFNAGWSSTGIRNWRETIDSDFQTTSEFGYVFPAGLPFGHMRVAINNYAAQLGVRAILWHQGETDNLANRTQADYLKDIREVIQATRDLSGKKELAWVVSRVSRFTVKEISRTWQPVIDAQNDVIGIGTHGADPNYKLPGVFAGPETDNYWNSEYRSDEVHFAGTGLLHLADFWTEKLNPDFFSQSTPYPALAPPNVTVSRSETADVTFRAPSGWSNYNWLSVDQCHKTLSNTQDWSVASGTYKLKVTDNFNNTVFSPAMQIPASISPSSIARNADAVQQKIITGSNTLLATECRIIAKVTPAVSSGLINNVLSATAYIDASVNTHLGINYVQRHFDFKTDVPTVSSKLTVYFSQAEFDAFNLINKVPLPKNPTDQTGIGHVRIIQFQGTSATGALGSYSGSPSEITPSAVLWNTTFNSWEISFDLANASGIFLSTINNALPVKLASFSGNVKNQSVSLTWTTVMESNASHFEVQRSNDARTFESIGNVSATGNSKNTNHYNYQDIYLPKGIYYYRLKQVDLDQSFENSRTIGIRIEGGTAFKVFPNPVSDRLSIQSETEIASVEITDLSGSKLHSATPNSHVYTIEMAGYSPGLYLVKVNNEVFKLVKK